MTFRDLAAYYLIHHATAPVWKDGKLISGLRSFEDTKQRVKILVDYVGEQRLPAISYNVLAQLRKKLLKRKVTRKGKANKIITTDRTLSVATVNRIMSICRAMLYVAKDQGWLETVPSFGKREKALIRVGDETERERILTEEEESRLIDACAGPRAHLRPIVITALDTGMRFGELKKLRWKDVDFQQNVIRLVASHTKTLRPRWVGMTERVRGELLTMWKANGEREDSVFGIMFNVDKSWRAARKIAGLDEDEFDTDGSLVKSRVRFHDLRHSWFTRQIEAGTNAALAGKIGGHSEPRTTARYTNPDKGIARRAAKALDKSRMKQTRKRLIAVAAKVMPRKRETVN